MTKSKNITLTPKHQSLIRRLTTVFLLVYITYLFITDLETYLPFIEFVSMYIVGSIVYTIWFLTREKKVDNDYIQ